VDILRATSILLTLLSSHHLVGKSPFISRR
jgi:hypothetical protein